MVAYENGTNIRTASGGKKIHVQGDMFSHLISKWVLNAIPSCSSLKTHTVWNIGSIIRVKYIDF